MAMLFYCKKITIQQYPYASNLNFSFRTYITCKELNLFKYFKEGSGLVNDYFLAVLK